MGDILFSNVGAADTTNYFDEYYGINHVSIFAYSFQGGYYCWEVGGDADPAFRRYSSDYFNTHVKRVARVPKFQGDSKFSTNLSTNSYVNRYNEQGSKKIFLNSIKPLKAGHHYTVIAKINVEGDTIYPRVMSKEDIRLSSNVKNEVK